MYDYIIADSNAIGYAGQHATKLSSGGRPTQAIFNYIKVMRDLVTRYPQAKIYNVWDGKAEWRFELLPGYKGDRRSTPEQQKEYEDYKAQRPVIAKALTLLGLAQMTSFIHEADDVAGLLIRQFMEKNPNCKILLITGDRDWLQLLRPNVVWQDLRDDSRTVHFHNFYEKTGYKTPFAFLQGKALQGDSSDCISGVGGIGEGTAPKILEEFGSIKEFWRKCDAGEYIPTTKALKSLWKGESEYSKEEWERQFVYVNDDSLDEAGNEKARKKALKAHMDAYEGQGKKLFIRNMKLMQLLKPEPLQKEHFEYVPGRYDEDAFLDLCGEYAFMSILRNKDAFLNPFKKVEKAA